MNDPTVKVNGTAMKSLRIIVHHVPETGEVAIYGPFHGEKAQEEFLDTHRSYPGRFTLGWTRPGSSLPTDFARRPDPMPDSYYAYAPVAEVIDLFTNKKEDSSSD